MRVPVTILWLALAAALVPGSPARAETLTLADCLRETAAHNPEIIAEQYAVQQAAGTRLVLRARALPSLGIGGILGYLGERNAETIPGKNGQAPTVNSRDSTALIIGEFQLNQSIFDAAIPASWRRGNLEVSAAQQNFYAVASTQLNQTRILFYQTLFQQENGAVLRQLDASLVSELKGFDQLATAGLTGRQQLLALQVVRTNFGTALLANVGGLQNVQTSLLQSMGREQGPAGKPGSGTTASIHLAGTLEDHALDFDPAAVARETLAHRPDLLSLRAMVRSANEDANIARAGYYPLVRVYLAGELVPQSFLQRTDTTTSTRTSDQDQTTEIRPGVQGNWTIIDTGAVRGAVRGAEAGRDELGISLRQAERDLPSNLAQVRARMRGAEGRIHALASNVGTAENTLNLIQNGVTQGLNSEIEVVDAQNGVIGSRSGLLTAELEMSLAHAEFDRLTGRYVRLIPQSTTRYTTPIPARK